MKIERSVEIDRPVQDVFEFIQDPNHDPIWCPSVERSTQVTGDGPTTYGYGPATISARSTFGIAWKSFLEAAPG